MGKKLLFLLFILLPCFVFKACSSINESTQSTDDFNDSLTDLYDSGVSLFESPTRSEGIINAKAKLDIFSAIIEDFISLHGISDAMLESDYYTYLKHGDHLNSESDLVDLLLQIQNQGTPAIRMFLDQMSLGIIPDMETILNNDDLLEGEKLALVSGIVYIEMFNNDASKIETRASPGAEACLNAYDRRISNCDIAAGAGAVAIVIAGALSGGVIIGPGLLAAIAGHAICKTQAANALAQCLDAL